MNKKIRITLIYVIFIALSLARYLACNRYIYYGELVGIKGTGVYHRQNCLFIKKSTIDKLIFFDDLYETAEYSYRPCKRCCPPSNNKYIQQVLREKAEQKERDEQAAKEAMEKLKEKALIDIEGILNDAKADYLNNIPIKTHLFAGLINRGLIDSDSKLIFNKLELSLNLAAASLHPTILPNEKEIDELLEKMYLSNESGYYKKIVDEDKKYSNSIIWYRDGKIPPKNEYGG